MTSIRFIDTVISEDRLGELDLQRFGVVELVDATCRPPRNVPVPSLAPTRRGQIRKHPKAPLSLRRQRLIIKVDDIDDVATVRRIYVALAISLPSTETGNEE